MLSEYWLGRLALSKLQSHSSKSYIHIHDHHFISLNTVACVVEKMPLRLWLRQATRRLTDVVTAAIFYMKAGVKTTQNNALQEGVVGRL